MIRQRILKLFLSDAEKERMAAAATVAGLPLASWARATLVAALPRQAAKKEPKRYGHVTGYVFAGRYDPGNGRTYHSRIDFATRDEAQAAFPGLTWDPVMKQEYLNIPAHDAHKYELEYDDEA